MTHFQTTECEKFIFPQNADIEEKYLGKVGAKENSYKITSIIYTLRVAILM